MTKLSKIILGLLRDAGQLGLDHAEERHGLTVHQLIDETQASDEGIKTNLAKLIRADLVEASTDLPEVKYYAVEQIEVGHG